MTAPRIGTVLALLLLMVAAAPPAAAQGADPAAEPAVSPERARQIEARALSKLRKRTRRSLRAPGGRR